jgi:hypothetical protein
MNPDGDDAVSDIEEEVYCGSVVAASSKGGAAGLTTIDIRDGRSRRWLSPGDETICLA